MGKHWAIGACFAALCGGCPTVDLGDTPPDIGACVPAKGEAYFESDIWPTYINNTKKSCVSSTCHVPGGNGGTLHYDTSPAALPNDYKLTLPQLNCSRPEESPLLTKPVAGMVGHGGGDIFQMSDPEVQTFLDWFN
jgi:hypothetical protein